MTKTILYFNAGNKCIIRALVSIYSLKKYWNGDISIVLSGSQNDYFVSKLKELNVNIIKTKILHENSLCAKSMIHKYCDSKLTMFLDADTVVINNIDEYFSYIENYDFVTGNFCDWKTNAGGMISRRIKQWRNVCPELIEDAIHYGTAVNTGVNGWKKDAEILKYWEPLCRKGYINNCTVRMIDELACQVLLPQYKHCLAGVEWGTSVKFGCVTDNTKIIHFHGKKHCCDLPNSKYWKEIYGEVRKNGFLDTKEHFGDRALRGSLTFARNNRDC